MKTALLYIILLCTTLAFSQKEASVWYFGNNAGLKFNDDGSLTALTDGKLATLEGCSSIADVNGKLLFYTDGISVWNKNHQIMSNGNGLKGDPSSTQSAFIVPNPVFSNIYYIFTLDAWGNTNGLCYSEVNMDLDNGLGNITSNKNILLGSPMSEKISAVKNASGNGYWVVAHGFNNNSFMAYSVTSSGVNTDPIISNVGGITSDSYVVYYAPGYMKFSPSGRKLISCNNTRQNVELFDFDTATGTVKNPKKVIKERTEKQAPGDIMPYGVEFSPSEDIVYITNVFGYPFQVLQYDLTVSNIPDSKLVLYEDKKLPFRSLQMGIDGKIYGSIEDQSFLFTINKPNVWGDGCDFKLNGISIYPRKCQAGLPQFVPSIFAPNFERIEFQNNCQVDVSVFTLNTQKEIINIVWDFGDGNTSNEVNPTHQYQVAGNYTVTTTSTSSTGKIATSSKSITIYDSPVANHIADQSLCGTENMSYNLSQLSHLILGNQSNNVFGVDYFLTLADANNQQNVLPSTYNLPIGTTEFYVNVYNLTHPECFDIANFKVNLYPNPIIDIPDSYTVCTGEEINVSAPSGFSAYLWSDGSTKDTINVSKAGNYSVTAFKDYQTTTCNTKKDFTVYNSSVATITKIDISQSSITIWASGEGKYEYSIDGMNYQDDPVFNNLTGSDYTIYVRDKNGCGTVTEEVVLLMYPEFFTPNGDGHNDNWGVNLLYLKQGSEASIFDRFGKLITVLSSQKTEWDGTYNGNPLPSDDYWFILKTQNGKEYRGHFSLKK